MGDLPPLPHWTELEAWIWQAVQAGEVADLNRKYDEQLSASGDEQGWGDGAKPRTVAARFLLDVLGRRELREAVTYRGLSIVGARFVERLELQGIRWPHTFRLDGCRFEAEILLSGAVVEGSLSLDGSACKAAVDMDSLNVGQSLFLRHRSLFAGDLDLSSASVGLGLSVRVGQALQLSSVLPGLAETFAFLSMPTTFHGDVFLINARIGDALTANGAGFKGLVHMNGIEVARSVVLSDGATFERDVDLLGAVIGGNLQAEHATFKGGLCMERLSVGHGLYLHNGTTFASGVELRDATIGGNLAVGTATTFKARLGMEGIIVRQSLYLREGSIFESDVILFHARIGNALDMTGADFRGSVYATGARAERSLVLGSAGRHVTAWGSDSHLLLGGAHFGDIDDAPGQGTADRDPWPAAGRLHLNGLVYDRSAGLRGAGADRNSAPRVRSLLQWLARDTSYAPQAYQHLAQLLRASGDESGANAVLFAKRERERDEAWRGRRIGQWLGLGLLRWTIGYGLGAGYFRAVAWVAVLVALGAAARVSSGVTAIADRGWLASAWASLDWMVPFIDLDERHKTLASRLGGWRQQWLYIQSLAGYVLASFIVAGLAGLTQGR